MRIITGKAKGQNLITKDSKYVRPTTDRVKEALFNILINKVFESKVLDLFAGFGSLGLEAISRGAEKAVFVEKRYDNSKIIKKNLKICGFEDEGIVKTTDVFKYLKDLAEINFDLIFMDPPYKKNLGNKVLSLLADTNNLKTDSLIILECHKQEKIQIPDSFTTIRERIYGDTSIFIFQKQGA